MSSMRVLMPALQNHDIKSATLRVGRPNTMTVLALGVLVWADIRCDYSKSGDT
ncbi:hypothetical protein GGR09_000663 [Bartonella heixiaziensis]